MVDGQELIKLDLTPRPQNQKERNTHTNRQNLRTRNSFQTGGHSATLILTKTATSIFLASVLN